MGEKRVVLKHHAHTAALSGHRELGAGHFLAVKADAAPDWALETGDQPQKCCLAATGGSQQSHEFSALQSEIDFLESPVSEGRVIAVPETVDLDWEGLHRHEARKCSPIVMPFYVDHHSSGDHHR